MRAFHVDLQEQYGLQGGKLACLLADCPMDTPDTQWRRPALIVIPGGAYRMVSRREGEPVASYFFGKGYQTFILQYACCPDGVRYPEQLLEAASAVDHVRKHADEYCVNPDEIFVVGFSAGGHLTGNLAVAHGAVSALAGRQLDCRPTAVGLGYPVISPKYGHADSHRNLLQGYSQQEQEALLPQLCLDEAVGPDTPPAFIYTTAQDVAVPPINSLAYAAALAQNNIPYELHIYPQGAHGSSTCSWEVCEHNEFLRRNARWLDDCNAFFRLYIREAF